MIKVLFICHGNICRSTMAEFMFKDMVKKEGMLHCFEIASAATSREEIGNGVHRGTVNKLEEKGISWDNNKRAVQMKRSDYDKYDYLIAMDENNLRNMKPFVGGDPEKKVYRLLDFADGGNIADPWYTGNFDITYDDIKRGLEGLIEHIRRNNGN